MGTEILEEVFEVIKERKRNPKPESYVAGLLRSGKTKEKIMEEAQELIEASAKSEIIHEAADLFFHAMVLLAEKNVELEDVMEELRRRRKR